MDDLIKSFLIPTFTFIRGYENHFPSFNSDIIRICEREFAESKNSSRDDFKSERLLRLTWALIHTRQPEDVQRAIGMLEGEQGSLVNTNDPLQMKLKTYILAVGYYKSGDYSKSLDHVDSCLEIAPGWRKATSLKKAIEGCMKIDGMTAINTTAVGIVALVAGGLAVILSRKIWEHNTSNVSRLKVLFETLIWSFKLDYVSK